MRSVPKSVILAVAMTASTMFLNQAHAETSIWDHNGSLMRLEKNDTKRKFVYEKPRGNLRAARVKRGTVLFDGNEKADGRFAGYAKLFRKGCDPIDYFVEGPYDKAKGEILLQGQSPIYSGNGCVITGYSDDGNASTLVFSLQGEPESAVASAPQAEPEQVEPRPSYLPPLSNERTRQDRFETEDSTRDYAARRDSYDRNRRYDGTYDAEPRFRDDPDYDDDFYDDDDYDEPAYRPYQPRWRRHAY